MEFIELCRKVISIDSSPSRGTREVALFLAGIAKARGFQVTTQEEVWADCQQMNILVRPAGTDTHRPPMEFLMQTHLDTPDPGPFGFWKSTGHNPFDAHIVDQKIYGLGAADVKLDFLCKLEALSTFDSRNKWKLPPVLVGTYGEELGMSGAMKLIRKNMFSARMALIGEPTGLKLIHAGKGMVHVEIKIPFSEQEIRFREDHDLQESISTQSRIFVGQPAHSSTPHLGDSAIKKMFDSLIQMPSTIALMEMNGGVNFNTVPAFASLEVDLNQTFQDSLISKLVRIYKHILELEKKFLQHKQPGFDPQHPTLTIGKVVTDLKGVTMTGSCRLPPIITQDIYEIWMKELALVCETAGATFTIHDYKKSYSSNPHSMLVRGCQEELVSMGLPPEIGTQPNTNEASLFSRLGIECISFGPGDLEQNTHTPEEHVRIEDLKKAILFYQRILERFCV